MTRDLLAVFRFRGLAAENERAEHPLDGERKKEGGSEVRSLIIFDLVNGPDLFLRILVLKQ